MSVALIKQLIGKKNTRLVFFFFLFSVMVQLFFTHVTGIEPEKIYSKMIQ